MNKMNKDKFYYSRNAADVVKHLFNSEGYIYSIVDEDKYDVFERFYKTLNEAREARRDNPEFDEIRQYSIDEVEELDNDIDYHDDELSWEQKVESIIFAGYNDKN